eukprot:Em0158g5a
MDLGPVQALWSQASMSNSSYERSKARSNCLPSSRIRADDGLYQKPELSFFDTAQKFAHVLGTGSGLCSLLQPADNESAEIPLAKATLLKDEVEDVYLTPGGSSSNMGALEGDSRERFGPTTSWSKEMSGGFLDVPLTDPITMEFSLEAFSGSNFKMVDDQQFYNDMFSTGQSFEDIIDGCGLVSQPIQSEQASAISMQDLLPIPDNLSVSEDLIPTVELHASVVPSVSSPTSSPTSVLEAILKMPPDTELSPSTPEVHAPQSKSSKPKGTMLLFGKHENEIIAKLKGVKKTEKRSLKNRLVAMPVEEFNSMLEQSNLSEIEVAFMKEWRRRGKNKTAAQLARKRRREDMSELDIEVDQLKRQNKEMLERYEQLKATVTTYKNKTLQLESELFKHHSGASRVTHTPHSQSGDVLFIQRTGSIRVQ